MYVRVVVVPNARRERVVEVAPTEFHMQVREPRVQNQANRRVIAILAERFDIPTNRVRLLTGHRSSTKIVDVDV